MAKIVVKETVTKEREIDISLQSFVSLIDSLSMEDRKMLLNILSAAIRKGKAMEFAPFKKGRLGKVISDFADTDLYEPEFLRDLEAGLESPPFTPSDAVPKITELRDDLKQYISRHGLEKKWQKARELFEKDPAHPSLNTELLEPKHRLIYSFRLDRKYRAIFIAHLADTVEVVAITKHYRKG